MKISVLVSNTKEAQKSASKLLSHYESVSPERADVFVVLGGDGTMLEIVWIVFLFAEKKSHHDFFMDLRKKSFRFTRIKGKIDL